MGKFIDFAYIKQHAKFPTVLAHYEIKTKGGSAEMRCHCPFHDDETPSMSVNTEKNVFTCHAASCGEKGNILEFVATMEDLEGDLRTAAGKLAEICDIALAAPKADGQKGKAKRRAGQPHDKKGRSVPEKSEKRAAKPARSHFLDDGPEIGTKPEPLTFELSLDPGHPYGRKRGLSDWQVETFGMGYCSRGTMKGRWCIPIHDEHGQLVAYIGRWIEDDLPDGEPRWKLPKGFDKSQVLFNLHRLIEKQAGDFVLVEGVFDAVRLWEDGINAVALLGSSISEAHVVLLKEQPFMTGYVALDGGATEAQDKVVAQVARHWFARSLILPDGQDPASVEYEWLQWHMPGMPPVEQVVA